MLWNRWAPNFTDIPQNQLEDMQRRVYSLFYLEDLCRDSNSFSDHFKNNINLTYISKHNNTEVDFAMQYARKV